MSFTAAEHVPLNASDSHEVMGRMGRVPGAVILNLPETTTTLPGTTPLSGEVYDPLPSRDAMFVEGPTGSTGPGSGQPPVRKGEPSDDVAL
jgi:hypothetical protein